MQKGIPIAIVGKKSVRHKICKTIFTTGLEIYA